MTKVLCDKCKKEISAGHRNCVSLFGNSNNGFDLCNDCVEKVVNFITDYEITKADEYKKGYHDGFADGKEEAWMDSMGDDL